ncbi:unnamed protein product [Trichogramma brassicae]|uniref:Uncharacterized protein n=1 Tax=Trichogramma brassicae TaxID=86971 RepID=A0A6H5HX42_9HYME|nr:unnamed protein product [Trichogramma brassicae]
MCVLSRVSERLFTPCAQAYRTRLDARIFRFFRIIAGRGSDRLEKGPYIIVHTRGGANVLEGGPQLAVFVGALRPRKIASTHLSRIEITQTRAADTERSIEICTLTSPRRARCKLRIACLLERYIHLCYCTTHCVAVVPSFSRELARERFIKITRRRSAFPYVRPVTRARDIKIFSQRSSSIIASYACHTRRYTFLELTYIHIHALHAYNVRELQLHRIDDEATTEDYNEKSTRGSPRERTFVKNRSRIYVYDIAEQYIIHLAVYVRRARNSFYFDLFAARAKIVVNAVCNACV